MKAAVRITALGVLAALALTVSACSNPTGGTQDSGVAADGTAEVQAKELTVWINSADSEAIKDVYTRFGEEYGVEMNIVEIPADGFETQVQTKWSSGDRPDILEYHATSAFWALNPEKNMVDLSDMPYVAKSGDLYDYVGSLNGKVYAAMTAEPGLLGLIYNKEVLERNGLEVPQTYDDLMEICTVLKEKDPSVTPIFESGGSAWPTQILGGVMYMSSAQKSDNWGQQVIDQETTFDAEGSPFTAGLTAYEGFKDAGCFNEDATTAQFEQSIAAVADGTAAMTALANGFVTQFNTHFGEDKAKTDATVAFAGVSADGPTAAWGPSLAGTWYVPKTGDADTESTALAFIQYATGEGYQQYIDASQTFPIIEGATDPTDVQQFTSDAAKLFSDSALAFNSNLVGFAANFPTYTTGILSDQETPEDAAQKAQTAFEQGAKAAKLPGW